MQQLCTARNQHAVTISSQSKAILVIHAIDEGVEVGREYDTTLVRDKIALGQAIPTPEETFEQLWQQLRLDLDVGYS